MKTMLATMKPILVILFSLLLKAAAAFKHHDIASVEDTAVPRHLSTMPTHMRKKIEYHMAANKAPYIHTYAEDRNKLSLGNRFIKCNDKTGKAKGKFLCNSMDINSYIYNVELGTIATELIGYTYVNDLWGWTDPEDGSEYALVGMFDGTSVVDISDSKQPVVLGFIETSGNLPPGDLSGFWRDVKVVNNIAYIGAEVSGHGLQVFDLTRLRDLPRPMGKIATEGDVPRLEPDTVITTISSSHNLVQFPELNKVMAVGLAQDATGCDIDAGESVAVFNLDDPLAPYIEECLSGDYNVCDPSVDVCTYDGYVHDGQCFVYGGPDTDYTDVPMCVFFCETEIVLFNMETLATINVFTYPDYAYVHQGWFSEDFATLFANDELDEVLDTTGNGGFPRLRVFDMSDLDNPNPPLTYFDNTNAHPSIDHNLYVKGEYIYSANYEAGSRVYKILPDTTLEEAAFFDTSTVCDDIANCDDPLAGSWTHFPYFDSGVTIGCSSFEGFYVFKPRLERRKKERKKKGKKGKKGKKTKKSKKSKKTKKTKKSKKSKKTKKNVVIS